MDSVAFIALFVGSLFHFVFAKDASTQTTEKPTMLEELKNLDVVDYLRSAALLVALAAPLLHGRRTWLMAVIIATAASSFADFFFPQQVLSHVIKTEVDVVHQYLLQVVAACNMGRLATMYQTWESRDPGVTTSIMVSTAIPSLIACVTSAFDYSKWQSRFNPQYLSLGLFPIILIALGCVVYVFRGSSFGKGNLDFRGRLSRHILVDIMFLFVATFIYYGFPDVPLATVTVKAFKADGVHYHLIRIIGVLAFSYALSGFMALGFQNESDQRSFLFGRLVLVMVTIPLVALNQWKHNLFNPKDNIGMFVVSTFLVGNILCGYLNLEWPKAKRS